MRDFNFRAQQPLLAVFRCLLFSIYWLEAPRKYGFGTSNKRLGLHACIILIMVARASFYWHTL